MNGIINYYPLFLFSLSSDGKDLHEAAAKNSEKSRHSANSLLIFYFEFIELHATMDGKEKLKVHNQRLI